MRACNKIKQKQVSQTTYKLTCTYNNTKNKNKKTNNELQIVLNQRKVYIFSHFFLYISLFFCSLRFKCILFLTVDTALLSFNF